MEISKHKLAVAKKILGAKNDTQTVDEALSMVIANKEIEKAIKNLFGSIPNFEDKMKPDSYRYIRLG
ncbi:MAG: hypothetical protein SCARUB_02300 [Candidatus Scalindua rubra]|uniref:Uncharacterized protein n=1 Tax=Candidatus Scalindua rubra TaxID=1872076 RepID=A0A1E3XAE2_9BACT|nr:MAG: hypothetical protein SCARUB_02300 [Candidatus Scalindua rubra]